MTTLVLCIDMGSPGFSVYSHTRPRRRLGKSGSYHHKSMCKLQAIGNWGR
jgi:hypothetical protein